MSKGRKAGQLVLLSGVAGSLCVTMPTPAHAQALTPVVDVCTGISLPRSAVTSIIGAVNTPIVSSIEGTVNGILDLALLGLLPDLSIDLTGILADAAAGAPISVQVLDSSGTVVGPGDCNVSVDGVTLNDPAGIAIGGNAITGLGATGQAASADDIDAIAFGNNASAAPGATAAVALGANASATAPNSVALGAGSLADRGPLAGYTAPGLTGTFDSAGSISVGAPGSLRQITNVAPGTGASDAATVGQVQGALDAVAALATDAVQYDDPSHATVTLDGAGGTTIANLAPGALTATSTQAVNGSQLFATNQQVGANTTAITNLDGRVSTNTTAITNLDGRVSTNTTAITNLDGRVSTNTTAITSLDGRVTTNTTAITSLQTQAANAPVAYVSDASPSTRSATPTNTAALVGATAAPVRFTNVAPGQLAASSTDAVNGAQLNATNQQVAANTTTINQHTVQIAQLQVAGPNPPLQYSTAAAPLTPNGGTISNDATLIGTGAGSGGPVALHNLADGVLANDAVNLRQLQAGLNAAAATVNGRFEQLSFDLREMRRDANAAAAGALAIAGLPQVIDSTGRMISGALGHYRGQTAFAAGFSQAFSDGRAVFKLSGSVDTNGHAGLSTGAGLSF